MEATIIELAKLTDYEKEFVTKAVEKWNDLMFGNDLDYRDNATVNIPKNSLSGVMGSLAKKNIIEIDTGHNDTSFQFIGTDGYGDYDNKPELV